MDKKELLNRLISAWSSMPELRFGQFVYNSMPDIDLIYNMTDEEFIQACEDYIKQLKVGG